MTSIWNVSLTHQLPVFNQQKMKQETCTKMLRSCYSNQKVSPDASR